MADDLIERVLALQQKSDELNSKGQTLRAAEKCGRGADLALASGAPEDSLIVVGMQARQGGFLLSHALSSVTGASEDARAPLRASGLRLLAQSSATLQRRRASDTLLEGKCSTMEESWKLALSCSGSTPRSVAVSSASLVGYDAHVLVASFIAQVLRYQNTLSAEMSSAQLHAFAHHIVDTVDLMKTVRVLSQNAHTIAAEAIFVQALRNAVALGASFGLDPAVQMLMSAALQQLESSGVLESRQIEANAHVLERGRRSMLTAIADSAAAPERRTCALGSCGAREAHVALFKSCAACRTVAYCCKEHQVEDWASHKAACKLRARRQRTPRHHEDEGGSRG